MTFIFNVVRSFMHYFTKENKLMLKTNFWLLGVRFILVSLTRHDFFLYS